MPYYRRNLLILSTTVFLASMSWSQIMPFLPLFLQDIGVKHNLLRWSGLIFAAHPVAAMFAQPAWGKLGDKYGRKTMVIRAGFCLGCIYFAMSLCTSPWQLVLLRFINGALTGFIPGSYALIATNTPQKIAPRAVATAQTASATGMIIGPAIGGLLAHIFGYHGSMRISGAAVLFATLLVWLLVQETHKPSTAEEQTSLLQDFLVALHSPILRSVMLAVALYGTFAAAINPILALHLKQLSGTAPIWLTGVIFSLPGLAFTFSAYLWTTFGERNDHRIAVNIGLAGTFVLAFLLYFIHNLWIFAAAYFAAGLCLAAITPSASAIICTRVNADFHGRAYGLQQSAGMLGALIAPLASGFVGTAFGIPSVFIMISSLFMAGFIAINIIFKRWPLPVASTAEEAAYTGTRTRRCS
ncbi:MAG: MFS transporter [bacterium]|jgi:DHA1 family multidrug resistance protein-like MFS transporter|nr:MFS transporter [bacterium]MDD4153105.1 MFS transporter [bacterium]MDD4558697.1 MFS transporter [bacterium]